MSKLLLTRHDIEKAIRQYYQDYEPDLYAKYDFENTDMFFEKKSVGYLGIELIIPQKDPAS